MTTGCQRTPAGWRRLAPTTVHPALDSWSAHARPIPDEAPVTRQTRLFTGLSLLRVICQATAVASTFTPFQKAT
jgi:hypothetical protein